MESRRGANWPSGGCDGAIATLSLIGGTFVKALEGQGYLELRMQRKYPDLETVGKECCLRFKTRESSTFRKPSGCAYWVPAPRGTKGSGRAKRMRYARLRTHGGPLAGSPTLRRCITPTCLRLGALPKNRYIPAMPCGRYYPEAWINMWNRCGFSSGTGSIPRNSWRNTVSHCSTRSRR